MEAGLDSLGAVDLRNALSTEFGVDIPATATFDYPTLPALAAFVASLLPHQGTGIEEPDQQHGTRHGGAPAAPEVDQSAIRCFTRLTACLLRGVRLPLRIDCTLPVISLEGHSLQPGITPSNIWDTACREQVAATVEGILGAAVPSSQPFMEAGLDSLGAVDLRNALEARFGVELPATATFDFPTVLAMAAHVGAMLDGARQVAAPQWPVSAVATPGSDFGEPTSAAVQVVGLSCLYPGQQHPSHVFTFCICVNSESCFNRPNMMD